jgi:cytochrome c oxidase subunit IV
MKAPVVSIRTYTLTWLALLALALATTLIGFLDLGPFSMGVAILIATAKAALVVAFFMHGKYESKVVRIIIAAGVVWFLILVSNTVGDYITRGWLPVPGK